MRSAPRNASSTQNDWRNLRRRSQQAWQRLQPSSQYFRFSQPNGRPTVHAVRRFAIIQIQKEISHYNTRQTLHGGSNARQSSQVGSTQAPGSRSRHADSPLPHDVSIAPPRRQGDSAQAPEQDFFPDIQRRP